MVVYNKFYLKFQDFSKAVNDFFENKIWLNEEFKNCLTDNFQIIKPSLFKTISLRTGCLDLYKQEHL